MRVGRDQPAAAVALAVALFAVPLTGCLSQDASPASDSPAEPSGGPGAGGTERFSVPTSWNYTCPPGGDARGSEICTRHLSSSGESSQEPYVAAHPTDPDVFTVLTNSVQFADGADLEQARVGARVGSLGVYWTDDGGRTWTRSEIPSPAPRDAGPPDNEFVYDPTAAFTPDGTLHVVAIANQKDNPLTSFGRPFHTSTEDGQAWTDPIVVSGNESDRPWVSVDREGGLVATFTQTDGSRWIAYAASGEQNWARTEVSEACESGPRPHAQGTNVLLLCQTGEAFTLYRFNLAEHTFATVGKGPLEEGAYPRLVTATPNRFVAVTQSGTLETTTSPDGGGNWTSVRDLRGELTVEDGWETIRLYWSTAGPEGGVHLVLAGGDPPRCNPDGGGLTPLRRVPTGCSVAHAVLEPVNMTVAHEQILTPEGPAGTSKGVSGGVPFAVSADDYYGLTFQGDRGVLAWTYGDGIEVTFVEPGSGGSSTT